MKINELSGIVIREAIEVHKYLGPGLLEKVYVECLAHRLKYSHLSFQRETPIPVIYDTVRLDCGYRADLVVENQLIIEVKSVDAIHEIFLAQMLTYLKFSGLHLGLLINFNVKVLKDGIRRVIL
jgi:GxxExxY protein